MLQSLVVTTVHGVLTRPRIHEPTRSTCVNSYTPCTKHNKYFFWEILLLPSCIFSQWQATRDLVIILETLLQSVQGYTHLTQMPYLPLQTFLTCQDERNIFHLDFYFLLLLPFVYFLFMYKLLFLILPPKLHIE